MEARFFLIIERHNKFRADLFCKKYLTFGDPGKTCRKCGSDLGPLRWISPHEVGIYLIGTDVGDFVYGNFGMIVSERFVKIYQDEGLAGLEGFEKVKVVQIKASVRKPSFDIKRFKDHIPEFYRVFPVVSETQIDDERSELERSKPVKCELCGGPGNIIRFKRLRVKEGTWKGEDIFRPYNFSGVILVSEKFVNVCKKHRLKNIFFVESDRLPEEYSERGYGPYFH